MFLGLLGLNLNVWFSF